MVIIKVNCPLYSFMQFLQGCPAAYPDFSHAASQLHFQYVCNITGCGFGLHKRFYVINGGTKCRKLVQQRNGPFLISDRQQISDANKTKDIRSQICQTYMLHPVFIIFF